VHVLAIELDHRERGGGPAGESGQDNTPCLDREHGCGHSKRTDRRLLPGAPLKGQNQRGGNHDHEAERERDRVDAQLERRTEAELTEVQLLGGADGQPQDHQSERGPPRAGADSQGTKVESAEPECGDDPGRDEGQQHRRQQGY